MGAFETFEIDNDMAIKQLKEFYNATNKQKVIQILK